MPLTYLQMHTRNQSSRLEQSLPQSLWGLAWAQPHYNGIKLQQQGQLSVYEHRSYQTVITVITKQKSFSTSDQRGLLTSSGSQALAIPAAHLQQGGHREREHRYGPCSLLSLRSTQAFLKRCSTSTATADSLVMTYRLQTERLGGQAPPFLVLGDQLGHPRSCS